MRFSLVQKLIWDEVYNEAVAHLHLLLGTWAHTTHHRVASPQAHSRELPRVGLLLGLNFLELDFLKYLPECIPKLYFLEHVLELYFLEYIFFGVT